MLQWFFTYIFAWLALILPILSWRKRNAYRRGAPGQRLTSRRLYLNTMAVQWALAGGLLFVFWRFEIPFALLGLLVPDTLPLAVVSAVLIMGGILWVRRQRRIMADPAKVAKLRATFGGISLLVPMTGEDMRWWFALSLTAGVCEEILYRGFFAFYLAPLLPRAVVACMGILIFGLSHLYQGWRNAGRTALLGTVFWGLYLATDSLLPGMVAHTLLDVRSGFLLRRAFTEPAPAAA